MAASVVCNFSFVFLQACATFACWVLINFEYSMIILHLCIGSKCFCNMPFVKQLPEIATSVA